MRSSSAKASARTAPPRVVGTSSVARRANLQRLFPGAEMKSIRGTIQGRLSQLDAGEYDAVVIAACALERLGLAGRIGSYLPFDPAPQQSRLAFVVRADDARLREALKPLDVRRTAGLVALVGCPADEALLPRRARTYLDKADIIVHDRLVPNRVLEDYAGKLVNVGKTGGDVSIAQSEIHRRLLAEAEAGKLVVRLHGGDPGIFGHLGETLDFLSAWNIRFDIVPAVTSAQAAAARARAALTHRDGGRSIILMSGHSSKPGNPALVTGPEHGNMAIYMGAANRAEMAQRLLNAGWPADTPVQVCQNLGYDQESVDCMTLADLPAASVATPAVMLVGTRPVPGIGHTLFTGTDPDLFLRHGPLIHWPFIHLENTPACRTRRLAARTFLRVGWRHLPLALRRRLLPRGPAGNRRHPRTARAPPARRRPRHRRGPCATPACAPTPPRATSAASPRSPATSALDFPAATSTRAPTPRRPPTASPASSRPASSCARTSSTATSPSPTIACPGCPSPACSSPAAAPCGPTSTLSPRSAPRRGPGWPSARPPSPCSPPWASKET
jgi:siroheme synthase